ncbi:MAG TPA: glycosyltransferase family 2 protein, partial [Patescibacteria group bacterium]
YDIIARTDADTILPPDWIEKIKKHFQDPNLVALSGPTTFYDLPSKLSKRAAKNVHKTYLLLMKQILKHDCLFGPNMAIRKKAWEKIKDLVCLDDKKVHEDIDLSIHVAPLGKILFDRTLEVSSSFRRFKNLEKIDSYVEYPYRVVVSVQKHKPFSIKQNSKNLMKKFASKILIKDLQ